MTHQNGSVGRVPNARRQAYAVIAEDIALAERLNVEAQAAAHRARFLIVNDTPESDCVVDFLNELIRLQPRIVEAVRAIEDSTRQQAGVIAGRFRARMVVAA